MAAPTIDLNNGQKFPVLGLGTWQAEPGEVETAVKNAIDVGYQHFDCAMVYGNEAEIGTAIQEKISEGAVKREDLFIVTKLWNTFHEKEMVVPTCKRSLKNFGLDYIDQYLIHWPVAQKIGSALDSVSPFANPQGIDYDYVDTWKGMEECVRLGLTKGIGVSNFNSKQLDRILENATIKPVVNEIEVHPYLNQKKLIQFCRDRDIAVTAYSPFASPTRTWAKPGEPELLNDPRLIQIGEKYGKSVAQVVLRYLLDIGTVPIPKSTNKKRIAQNINVFDFKLTPEEIVVIDRFNRNWRAVPALELKDFPNYPFLDDVEY